MWNMGLRHIWIEQGQAKQIQEPFLSHQSIPQSLTFAFDTHAIANVLIPHCISLKYSVTFSMI